MMQFDENDLANVSEALYGLHSQQNGETLWQTMISVLDKVVPSSAVAYNEVDHSSGAIRIFHNHPAPGLVQALTPTLERLAGEHPVHNYQQQSGERRALSISDFLSLREFKRSNLYNEFYRPLGITHQASVYLPSSPRLQIALTLQRDTHDFTPRDKFLLNLLAPHFALAHSNAGARPVEWRSSHGQPILRRLKGAIRVNGAGQLLGIDEPLTGVLRHAFRLKGKTLPVEIAAWFKSEARSISSARVPERLQLRREAGSWEFTLQPAGHDEFRILVRLEPADPATALQQLGVTPREAQVLYWIAGGKTNPEIALILGTSIRTIHKHVERILARLDVENRQAACALVHRLFSDLF